MLKLKNALVLMSLIGTVSTAHATQATCMVYGPNPTDANKFDQLLSESQYDLSKGPISVVLANAKYVRASQSPEGSFSLSVSSIEAGGVQPTMWSIAVSETLPLSLTDGTNKISVFCR